MPHEAWVPQGKIELLHEWRDTPAGHDAERRHISLEANAKGLLVLTESILSSNQARPRPPIEIYEIGPDQLIKLIRKHGEKLRLH